MCSLASWSESSQKGVTGQSRASVLSVAVSTSASFILLQLNVKRVMPSGGNHRLSSMQLMEREMRGGFMEMLSLMERFRQGISVYLPRTGLPVTTPCCLWGQSSVIIAGPWCLPDSWLLARQFLLWWPGETGVGSAPAACPAPGIFPCSGFGEFVIDLSPSALHFSRHDLSTALMPWKGWVGINQTELYSEGLVLAGCAHSHTQTCTHL